MADKLNPIWVKNPKTDKEYNIAPMFEIINHNVFSHSNSFKELELYIDESIRYIGIDSKSLNPEGDEMNTVLFNLYQLRDMFEAIDEKKE